MLTLKPNMVKLQKISYILSEYQFIDRGYTMLPIIISSIENPEDRDLMTAFYLAQKSRICQKPKNI